MKLSEGLCIDIYPVIWNFDIKLSNFYSSYSIGCSCNIIFERVKPFI